MHRSEHGGRDADRERLHAELEQAERLLEAAPDAILLVAPDGTIRFANRQAEMLFGFGGTGGDQLVGTSVERLIPVGVRERHPGLRHGFFANPTVRPMGAGVELAAVRADGSELPVDISLSPVDTPDGLMVAAAIRDITERKTMEAERERLEARLQQSQRLEALGQLAGGVAHDFNNLLVVISNLASLAAEEVPEGSRAHRDLREIRATSQRAAELTRRLLIFGRREVVVPQTIDLDRLVAGTAALLERSIGDGIDMVVELDGSLPRVSVDPTSIEQVVLNLVVNARDAMADGGMLSLRTRLDGDAVVLTVSDTGVGMSAEVQARAFEPFFTTKPQGVGTGLGLATAYGAVQQARGEISIQSEPGRGTTVEVRLPVDDAPRAETSRVGEAGDVDGSTAVLWVEDQVQVRRLGERLLRRAGFSVHSAGSGEEALGIADRMDRLDLLITDVSMPGMSGRDLAIALAQRCDPAPATLFVSGYPGSHEITEELGELLPKPFDEHSLAAAVARALA